MVDRKQFGKRTGQVVTSKELNPDGTAQLQTFVPWTVVKPVPVRIVAPAGTPAFTVDVKVKPKVSGVKDSPLLRALGLAHHWQRLLDEERIDSVAEIARLEDVGTSQVNRTLRLTRLAPQVVQHLVDTPGITVEWVMVQRWPRGWLEQGSLAGVAVPNR